MTAPAPTPKRERFWGLYDTSDERWLMACPPETNVVNPAFWFGKAAVPGMLKRKRFITASAAQGAIWRARLDLSVIPRPFYVVRKPRPHPDRLQIELMGKVVLAAKGYCTAVGAPADRPPEVYAALYYAVMACYGNGVSGRPW